MTARAPRKRAADDDWRARERRAEVARAIASADEDADLGAEPPRPLYVFDDRDDLIVVMTCPPWNRDPDMYALETRNILVASGERYFHLHMLPPELRNAVVDKWVARELADDLLNPRMSELDSDEDCP